MGLNKEAKSYRYENALYKIRKLLEYWPVAKATTKKNVNVFSLLRVSLLNMFP